MRMGEQETKQALYVHDTALTAELREDLQHIMDKFEKA